MPYLAFDPLDPEAPRPAAALARPWRPLELAPGLAPPREAELWAAGAWTWARLGAERFRPAPLGAAVVRPGQGLLIAAPAALPGRALAGAVLAVPAAGLAGALAAFLAFGRGRQEPHANASDRILAAGRGGARAALLYPGEPAPEAWWSLDLAAWWLKETLSPLVLGLLWRAPGTDPSGLAGLFPPAGPDAREGLRQLMLGAAELGLVAPETPARLAPACWRG